ncbi:Zinc/iron permease [Suillus clintonianus]|uniref:Zinc/iron permease n=1 Tax=Suillus clintonianus TaxID=1904413 RepID=UPI001B871963|nr:Zinc/iron permease [Suillus clintonianus]KAG2151323.1 Zinc/iron permease [Suillus clintonianus]
MASSGFIRILSMSLVMGAASFGAGLVPLSSSMTKSHLAKLSTLSTGLLIGAALGVIIPEGVASTIAGDPEPESYSYKIASCVLFGFAFMFLVEEYISPHTRPLIPQEIRDDAEEVHFDIVLDEMEREEGMMPPGPHASTWQMLRDARSSSLQRAYPLSLGLIVHALVDGYALGVSSLETQSGALSFVVFLAIIIHKAPTALALTSSLLATSLPPSECKRHLLLFSLATPVSAILSYILYTHTGDGNNLWVGTPLLFSGGTFLYVATVLQSPSERAPSSAQDNISKTSRTLLLLSGMFFPLIISAMLGHGH